MREQLERATKRIADLERRLVENKKGVEICAQVHREMRKRLHPDLEPPDSPKHALLEECSKALGYFVAVEDAERKRRLAEEQARARREAEWRTKAHAEYAKRSAASNAAWEKRKAKAKD